MLLDDLKKKDIAFYLDQQTDRIATMAGSDSKICPHRTLLSSRYPVISNLLIRSTYKFDSSGLRIRT